MTISHGNQPLTRAIVRTQHISTDNGCVSMVPDIPDVGVNHVPMHLDDLSTTSRLRTLNYHHCQFLLLFLLEDSTQIFDNNHVVL